MHHVSIFNKLTRCSWAVTSITALLDYSTCFGRFLHPSSGAQLYIQPLAQVHIGRPPSYVVVYKASFIDYSTCFGHFLHPSSGAQQLYMQPLAQVHIGWPPSYVAEYKLFYLLPKRPSLTVLLNGTLHIRHCNITRVITKSDQVGTERRVGQLSIVWTKDLTGTNHTTCSVCHLAASAREHIECSRVGRDVLDECHCKNDWSKDSGYFYPAQRSM